MRQLKQILLALHIQQQHMHIRPSKAGEMVIDMMWLKCVFIL